jgi:hypothetical protein
MKKGDHHQDFMDEDEMQQLLSKKFGQVGPKRTIVSPVSQQQVYPLYQWYKSGDPHGFTYDHHTLIAPGNVFNCETITDKWFQWFLSTPKEMNPFTNPGNIGYSETNAFLFHKDSTFVFFVTASPFQKPYFARLVMTRRVPLLVPVYNIVTSPSFYKNKAAKGCLQMVKDDLKGIKKESVEARFDDKPLYGCCVIRRAALPINDVPADNVFGIPETRLNKDANSTIGVYHGGFWLLIKASKFSSGDHLLYFKAESRNYEIEAKILITVLV